VPFFQANLPALVLVPSSLSRLASYLFALFEGQDLLRHFIEDPESLFFLLKDKSSLSLSPVVVITYYLLK